MKSDVPLPPWWGVALSLVLVGFTGAIVVRQRLGLGRDLLEATVRAGVQLVAVGLLLRALFAGGLAVSMAWVVAMVALAGVTVGRRARPLPRAVRAATAAIAAATTATLGVLLGARVIEARASIVVPLAGVIVSAALSGATIAMSRLRDEATSSRAMIEARLALGLPGRAAFRPHLRAALRAALVPPIDQTKVVGLVTLPGAMTGLIIAGVSPVDAIRYQIIVMYMWLASAGVAALVAGRLAADELFDDAHRLRHLAA